MDRISLARQALFEHELLDHLKKALRMAVAWQSSGVGLERKCSSVCFTAQSLGRHLERLMAIEEEGGYMREVLDRKPQLTDQVMELKADHDYFRRELALLMPVAADGKLNESMLSDVCRHWSELLDRIDQHDRKEIDLFQEGLVAEEGSGD